MNFIKNYWNIFFEMLCCLVIVVLSVIHLIIYDNEWGIVVVAFCSFWLGLDAMNLWRIYKSIVVVEYFNDTPTVFWGEQANYFDDHELIGGFISAALKLYKTSEEVVKDDFIRFLINRAKENKSIVRDYDIDAENKSIKLKECCNKEGEEQ